MTVPPNLLRSQVEDFEQTPNHPSTKLHARRDRILTSGRHLIALHGLRNLRVCDLALAMNITSAAIRYHFADLDALLIEKPTPAAQNPVPGSRTPAAPAPRRAPHKYARPPSPSSVVKRSDFAAQKGR
jgi:hypothetical protein